MKISMNMMKTQVPRDKATAMRLASNGIKIDKKRKPFTPDPKKQVQSDEEGFRQVVKSRKSTPEVDATVHQHSGGSVASPNPFQAVQGEFDDHDTEIVPMQIHFPSQEEQEQKKSKTSPGESEIERKKAIRKEKKDEKKKREAKRTKREATERKSKKGEVKEVTGMDAIEDEQPKSIKSSKKPSSSKREKKWEKNDDTEKEAQDKECEMETGDENKETATKTEKKKSKSKAHKESSEEEKEQTEKGIKEAADLEVLLAIKSGKQKKDRKSSKKSTNGQETEKVSTPSKTATENNNKSTPPNNKQSPITILRPSTPSQTNHSLNKQDNTQSKSKTPSKQTDLRKWKKSPESKEPNHPTLLTQSAGSNNRTKLTTHVGKDAIGETVTRYTSEEARLVHRVISEREVQFAIRVIQLQMDEQRLNIEDLEDYPDFQQAQILMTLIWQQVQEKHSDINAENFVRATHSMEVNNLIETFNNPAAFSNLITAIRYGSHPYISEANSSPYSCKDLIDKALVDNIIQEAASNKTYIKAIGQYIERYYPYRTEAVWTCISQQSVEELKKVFFKRGALHNIIIANKLDTQYVKPYIVILSQDTEYTIDGSPEQMIPNDEIKMAEGKDENDWQQARATIIAALVPFIKKHFPKQSNKLQQLITVARGVKLNALLRAHGVLNDWAHVTANFDPKPWLKQNQDEITAKLMPNNETSSKDATPSNQSIEQGKASAAPPLLSKPPDMKAHTPSNEAVRTSNNNFVHKYGIDGDATNEELIQIISIRQDNLGTDMGNKPPAELYKEWYINTSRLACRMRHDIIALPFTNNPNAKELCREIMFPPDDVLEAEYMTKINRTQNFTSFNIRVCISFNYFHFKKSAPTIKWKWAKNEHMSLLDANNTYTQVVVEEGIARRKYSYASTIGIIGSSMAHDSLKLKSEFLQLVKNQLNQTIDPSHIIVQLREVSTPSSHVPVMPRMTREQRDSMPSDERMNFNQRRILMQVILVKNDRRHCVAALANQLKKTTDRIKYPTLAHCELVDIRTEAYDTREEWHNIMNKQNQYYQNKKEVVITGIPEHIELDKFVPDIEINGSPNTYTAAQLLTGFVSLGARRDGIPIAPFHRLSKGRDKGSYILEGFMVDQRDIRIIAETYLVPHLRHWLEYEADTSMIAARFSPARGTTFEGINGTPLPGIEEESVTDHVSISEQDYSDPPIKDDETHMRITGQRVDGSAASSKALSIPNYNHQTNPDMQHESQSSNHNTESNNPEKQRSATNQSNHDVRKKKKKDGSQAFAQQILDAFQRQTEMVIKQLDAQNERIKQMEDRPRKRKQSRSPSPATSDSSDDENQSEEEMDDSSSDSSSSSDEKKDENDSDDDSDSRSDSSSSSSSDSSSDESDEDNDDDNSGGDFENKDGGQHQDNCFQEPNDYQDDQNEHTDNNAMSTTNHNTQPSYPTANFFTMPNKHLKWDETKSKQDREFRDGEKSHWFYADEDNVLYQLSTERAIRYDHRHRNYFDREGTQVEAVSYFKYPVNVTICRKVIKAHDKKLESLDDASVSINSNNFTDEDISRFRDDFEKDNT
jgi:hypothetical protein